MDLSMMDSSYLLTGQSKYADTQNSRDRRDVTALAT